MEPKDNFARGLGTASLVFAGVALLISFWQAHLQQRSYDRAAGKIKAALKIVSALPPGGRLPAKHVDEPQRGGTLEHFIQTNYRIQVRNTGDEPIEALRVEVRFIGGANDVPPDPKRAATGPLVLKQCSRKDYELSGTLAPGHMATVPIGPTLLEQMSLSSNRQAGDKTHIGVFEIRCLGRLVGVNHFDPSDPSLSLAMVLSFTPNDYPPAGVQSYIDTFQPHIASGDQ